MTTNIRGWDIHYTERVTIASSPITSRGIYYTLSRKHTEEAWSMTAWRDNRKVWRVYNLFFGSSLIEAIVLANHYRGMR